MFYSSTSNMQKAENSLLSLCKDEDSCPLNCHGKSNVSESNGYVYVIKKYDD